MAECQPGELLTYLHAYAIPLMFMLYNLCVRSVPRREGREWIGTDGEGRKGTEREGK